MMMTDKLIKVLFYAIVFTCFEWFLLQFFYFVRNIRLKINPPYTPDLTRPILFILAFNIITLYVFPKEYSDFYLYAVIAICLVFGFVLAVVLNGSIVKACVDIIKEKIKLIFETKQEKENRLKNTESPYIPPTEISQENINKDAVLLREDSHNMCSWYIIPNTIKLEYEGNHYEGSASIKTIYLNKEVVLTVERWQYYVVDNKVKIFYLNRANDSWIEILVYDRSTGKLNRVVTAFWLIAGEWLWKVKMGCDFREFSKKNP